MTARILVVDDIPANARLLEARLAVDYYQTKVALDGFTAIGLAQTWQPDLILLDIMMPGMDGYECCRRLKDDAATLHIPVVMVTALGEPEERLRGLEVGADDFLTKPVDFDTLMARTRSLVRLKRLLDEWRARGDTARALGLAGERATPPSVAGARALVVDDWDVSAEAVQESLRREGIVAGRARTEAEATQLSNAVPFDLIIISLSMTSDDPLRLAAILRAADTTHELPMLLIAESEHHDKLLRGFDMGASDWVTHPIDDNELRVRARNQVRRKYYQDRLRSDLGHALSMALTDPLTGLYNQRYLMRHLRSLLENNQRSGLAVLMIDVDHFKNVNDEYGHDVGDKALVMMAEALRMNTRVFDSLARYGGEEFAAILPGTTMAEAQVVAERLRMAVADLSVLTNTGGMCKLTVSVGIAYTTRDDVTPESLLRSADQALYEAKRGGRNQVKFAA